MLGGNNHGVMSRARCLDLVTKCGLKAIKKSGFFRLCRDVLSPKPIIYLGLEVGDELAVIALFKHRA